MDSLLLLPAELLHQIALHFDVSDVASFASTCRATRSAARPLLFRTMTVASVSKLESLSNADAAILSCMRHFNIRLEYDFFEAFAAACNPTAFPHCTALRHKSLLPALAHILLSAPLLSSLQVQIPDSIDSCASAWPQLLRLNSQGISLGPALVEALPNDTVFPALRTLRLDGISQLTPLVRMTPNLVSLSAHMCEGFSEQACRELVQHTLPLAPCLEEVAFEPFSLHFAGSDLNVPKAITAAAPRLQTLDLRSRAFDYSTGRTEWRTMDKIDPLDCVPAGSKLKELHLPFAPAQSTSTLDPHKASMLDDRARETEFLATLQLASAAPLQKVSWLRADSEEPIEYSIERDALGVPVHISVLGGAQPQEGPLESGAQSSHPLGGLASVLASVATNTAFHAAVVMWLVSDSASLPFQLPSTFATPALLATGVALGLTSRLGGL